MNANIVDNRQIRLTDAVQTLLADGAVGMRLAVGYLFLEGLAPLQAQLAGLDDIQILIGNVVNRLTDEQVREEADTRHRGGEDIVRAQEDMAAPLREAHARAAAVTALNLRRTLAEMPHTNNNRDLLLTLARRIADGGLKVRLFLDGRIHAKLALLDYPSVAGQARQIAVVGSSNLTLSGPAHPTEMNIIVRDPESTQALDLWFQGLWNQSQDFHRELFDELGQCWAMDTNVGEVALPAASVP